MRHQLPLALLLASTASCMSSQDSTDTTQAASAIEQPNGGLDTADEAPQFGEEADFAAAGIESDNATTDSMATNATVAALDTAADVDAHQLVVLWGRLPGDPTATDHRDWSGSLQVSRGALVVGRTIAFEARTDALLPRATPDTVSFTSVTGPFVDGLALRVLAAADPTATPPTLTYTPADGSASFVIDLAQLATGPIVIDAGGGYKIIAASERRDAICHGGFMRGRWHALAPHLGHYLGVVADRTGQVIGHVRGVYGQRRNGDDVMFGKFIDRDGKFMGILAGSYGNGEYKARWIDRAGDHGTAHGKYFEGAALRGGGFLGRWSEAACSEDPAQP